MLLPTPSDKHAARLMPTLKSPPFQLGGLEKSEFIDACAGVQGVQCSVTRCRVHRVRAQ